MGGLERLVVLVEKPIYCVIDGIDESVDFDETMLTRIMQLLGVCPNVRVLLLGRPHAIQALLVYPDLEMIMVTAALLNRDIEALIDHEISKSEILSLPALREDVYQTLSTKSEGMFLWVRLMIDDPRKSSSRSELRKKLANLPRGLEEAYRLIYPRLTQELDDSELRLAQHVLTLTAISCRPLHFEEFRHAHALYCRSLELVGQPLEEYLLLQPPQRVLDVVGGLVCITDGFLRLIHSSVKDFLIRSKDQWICESNSAVPAFQFDVTQAHCSFAWLCLDYLGLEIEGKNGLHFDASESMRTLRNNYPLLQYATLYTFYHLNRSGAPSATTLAKMKDLLESTQSVFWLEHFAFLLFEDLTFFFTTRRVLCSPGLDR